MPTIVKRDGARPWLAQVRVKPYKAASKTFDTKHEAKEWADSLERELKRQRKVRSTRPSLTRYTVAELIRDFLADPETNVLRTYTSLQLLLAWWVNHYGANRVLDVGALTLREARAKLQPGRKPATVNRYLSALRSAWNWGRAAELIPQKLSWPSRLMLTEPKGRTRFLSDDELARLLEASAAHSPLMHAAVLVSIACGVRQSELLRLKWADLDFDKQRLRVMLSKNDEARSVYLPQSAATALKALKRAPVLGQQVFTDETGRSANKGWIEHRWKLVRSAAKLQDFKWHDLRHSCASFLAQQGANLLEIGAVLGHRSASVTRRYAHLVEGAPVTGHTKLDEKLGGAK
ncbi:MAG TPA: site-specific integrase [Steroidobacteraceae bacterium]|nr:site-specific integrase [Steroidobacteraceae bacterium]